MVKPINIGIFTFENIYEPQEGTLKHGEGQKCGFMKEILQQSRMVKRQDEGLVFQQSSFLNIYNIWLAAVARPVKTVSRKDVRITEPVEPTDVTN